MNTIDLITAQFSATIKKKLGSHLKSLIIFGSRARGDASPTSDYDFLVIVNEKNPQIVQTVRKIEVDMIDAFGVLSGSLIFTEQEWASRKNFPIAKNIEREGIAL